jgi:ElaB/YqjD/DUF883 family membrane-anchored ribosome-binding protein
MTATTSPSSTSAPSAQAQSSKTSAGRTLNEGLDTAVSATTAKVASAAHTAVDIAAENVAHAEKALRDARAAVGEKVTETAKHARSYSEDALESVKAYIDLYPLRSVGIALAAGFLISSLLKK